MLTSLISFILGAIVAFLISWYWIRKYGSDIESKVNSVYDKFEDEAKQKFNEYFEQIKNEIKEQLAKKNTKTKSKDVETK